MISWRCFEMRQKLWKIIRKTYVVEFPCKKLLQLQEYSLQPTTGVKIALQIHSGSPQNFSLTLQPCSPEYLTIRKNFFSGDVGKTAVKKVLKNHQKNFFSSVPFKKFELSNQCENWLCRKYFLWLFREF